MPTVIEWTKKIDPAAARRAVQTKMGHASVQFTAAVLSRDGVADQAVADGALPDWNERQKCAGFRG
jgi:hypothetical protein